MLTYRRTRAVNISTNKISQDQGWIMKAYEFHNNLCISWRMKIAPMPAFVAWDNALRSVAQQVVYILFCNDVVERNLHRWYKVYQIAELITVL